jgi:dolichol-phosphate mannosyltransferase
VIYFLLPAYNEESGMDELLVRISAVKFPDENAHIVVVDDGSTDSTPGILNRWTEKIGLTVLTHKPNQGLGRAMRTGLAHLADTVNESDAVIAMDSDNTHDPLLAPRMRKKQLENGFDVVIASRYAVDENEPGREVGLAWHRKILSRGASIILSTSFNVIGAKDYTCGFRLYSGSILKKATKIYGDDLVTEKNFVCMAEILVKLNRIGAKISEVPLTLRYDLKGGASKLRVLKTILRYFNLIWRYKILGELNKYPAG